MHTLYHSTVLTMTTPRHRHFHNRLQLHCWQKKFFTSYATQKVITMFPTVCHLTPLELTEYIQSMFKSDFYKVHSPSHCSFPWGIATKCLHAFLTPTPTHATCHCHLIFNDYHSINILWSKIRTLWLISFLCLDILLSSLFSYNPNLYLYSYLWRRD
jgi:hypothetical protein